MLRDPSRNMELTPEENKNEQMMSVLQAGSTLQVQSHKFNEKDKTMLSIFLQDSPFHSGIKVQNAKACKIHFQVRSSSERMMERRHTPQPPQGQEGAQRTEVEEQEVDLAREEEDRFDLLRRSSTSGVTCSILK